EASAGPYAAWRNSLPGRSKRNFPFIWPLDTAIVNNPSAGFNRSASEGTKGEHSASNEMWNSRRRLHQGNRLVFLPYGAIARSRLCRRPPTFARFVNGDATMNFTSPE